MKIGRMVSGRMARYTFKIEPSPESSDWTVSAVPGSPRRSPGEEFGALGS